MASETLTPIKKAAAIVIALGAERASEVYKFLNEEEIEQLSLEIAKLERLSPEDMQETVEDFYGLCITQKVINEGGVLYAKDVLEKAFGQQQASSFMERLSKSLRSKSFEFIRKADSKNIQMILQNEHPQTIALILSYARSDQAAQIIAELPRNIQLDVIKRIAELDRVSPEMIKLVEATLEKRFSAIVTSDQVEVGGVPYIAEIMNRVDRATEKFIFDELGEKDAALADEIHKLMFVFEDIATLDSMTIQRFIREVDTKDLAVALKSANGDVSNKLFMNMSARMAESIRDDLEITTNVRMKDVEDAQQRIVGIIRDLEEKNEIVILKGGKDDIIA